MKTYREFWPYYLSQHRNPVCRALHFVGTTAALTLVTTAGVTGRWWLTAFVPVAGYGFAWIGHFFFERNRPATFRHPVWSLRGDFEMYGRMLLRLPLAALLLALALSGWPASAGTTQPSRHDNPGNPGHPVTPAHPLGENLAPQLTGPQYAAILDAIPHWPKRRLPLAAPSGAPASAASVSVRLFPYSTRGREHAIAIGQSMSIAAPLETVRGVLEDFAHYKDLFFDFKDAHASDRDGNRVVTHWEQSIPLPFVPNTLYATYFYTFDESPGPVFYRYQLQSSNSLLYSDGLIVIERDEREPARRTRYTEYDFFDANWGVAASIAPTRIWTDSLKGLYDSDVAIKLRAEHADWSYDQIRRETKRLWEEEYSSDAISDLLDKKPIFE